MKKLDLQTFSEYKPLINDILKSNLDIMKEVEISDDPISEEQKREVMTDIISAYLNKELSPLLNSERKRVINDLKILKLIIDFVPIEKVYMGAHSNEKINFIKKYGIDNIIALDEKTNGMFSHKVWGSDIYLSLFACTDKKNLDIGLEKLTNEEFEDKMYEILLNAKEKGGMLYNREYPDYDFIQGEFREKHPEIFIDEEINLKLKEKFYTSHMLAEDIKENPELIEILKEKDLSKVFAKKIAIGMGAIINMAQYLLAHINKKDFLKICADYGKCLYKIDLYLENDITTKSLREKIEENIYEGIKKRGLEYSEELPLNFKEKHPDLFLPSNISEEIRKKFYEGNLNFEDIRKNPQIKDILLTKDISVGFEKIKYDQKTIGRIGKKCANPMWEVLSDQEIMNLAKEYGKYLDNINTDIFKKETNNEKRKQLIHKNIEENIIKRISVYDENVPDFFRKKYPKMFLDENAPEELKKVFYDRIPTVRGNFLNRDNIDINFKLIKEHPEWKKFLKDKELSRAFPNEYNELFKRFDNDTLIKIGMRNPETIEKMVENHKEDVLENWYKATGGKFVPHHVVMLNFPENEIDKFLVSGKRWSQLMKIDNHNMHDDGKTAILKAAYIMGVFHGSDDGFNKTMKLFTDIPQELSKNEYLTIKTIFGLQDKLYTIEPKKHNFKGNDEKRDAFEETYRLNEDGKYVLNIDKQKNKANVKFVREMLEKVQMPGILTPQKAHQIFDSFAMKYNLDFVKFFSENAKEILSNAECAKDIATIQRQFSEIVRTNAGRKLTLDIAQDYIKNIAYTDIEIGNERVAEQAKIVGYSQKDFEEIQKLYNEGEMRDFSSIPRIEGQFNGYTYEMLRCDDPLALTIGTLTNCCQEIHGAGQTSMEHSVVSPDGRVFCVKDAEGRIVAQSWFWRNQYTGCFDNIEIPDRIFELYEKKHPDTRRKGLAKEVLEVYKEAAQDLMKEDKKVYKELLKNGKITQEQYDSLLLGKVTIGLGYNDIAIAIKSDKNIYKDKDQVKVKSTERFPSLYTDADIQYTILEREKVTKSNYENLYVHEDDIPVYDGDNMSSTVLLTMKKMEQAVGKDDLSCLSKRDDEINLPKSQRIINDIAREYELNPENTKVMATSKLAIVYSQDENEIKIGELLSAPIKENLTNEQKQKAENHIMYQLKKALKQMKANNKKVNLLLLNKEQKQKLENIIQEIENDERGER